MATKRALNSLFTSVKVGELTLPNRICVASMTRCRGDPATGIPNDLHIQYYSARASAGLILTECSQVRDDSLPFLGSAGIHSNEQVEGWKKVTKAVHDKGGRIFNQLWHSGRAVHPINIQGRAAIAPSAIAIQGQIFTAEGPKPHAVPREMNEQDIKDLIKAFRVGAENAQRAGFDGVELHGAFGYIIDQFLKDFSNKRTDSWGGSIENRTRLALEVLDQIISVWGPGRVGIKLSPVVRYNDSFDSNPLALYGYLIEQLNKRKLAYIQVMGVEPREDQAQYTPPVVRPSEQIKDVHGNLKPLFKGSYIANMNLNETQASDLITQGNADLVSFARLFINHPDLVEKLQSGQQVAPPKVADFFYFGGAKGYTDLSIYQ